MSALAVPVRDYDPLRDKRYRDTALGPDIVAWLAWMELGGTALRSLDQYERDLAKVAMLYPSKGVGDLTDLELSAAVRTFPPASRRVRKSPMDTFFRWAVRTRRIDKNPMDFLPSIKRPAQKILDVFTDAEIEALAALPLIDGALTLTLLDAGIRKAEARMLQAKHIDLERSKLFVIQGKGGKDRIVPLSQRLASKLSELFVLEGINSKDYLWYTRPGGYGVNREKPVGEGTFARWWTRCIADAGVRYRRPHTARHTFATTWRRRGLAVDEIQILLGHASIATTSDLYIHSEVEDVARHMELIEAGLA
jgi:integrase/recombinase XerD